MFPHPTRLSANDSIVAVAKMLGISRAKAAELIESGQARVLGRDISKSSTLQSGETVEFDIVEERTEPEPIARDMTVVYEDDDVIVVDKPVGVAAHASVGWTGRRCSAVCLTGECTSPPTAPRDVRVSYPASTWAHPD